MVAPHEATKDSIRSAMSDWERGMDGQPSSNHVALATRGRQTDEHLLSKTSFPGVDICPTRDTGGRLVTFLG